MPDTTRPYKFAGFSSPNTTPVPDVLFDELLLILDNAELRVLLYIIRRTFGFKRSTDDISISQMVGGIRKKDGTVLDWGTGISKASVTRGLKGLLEKGIIIARRNTSKEHGFEPTSYTLKFKNETNPLVSNMGQGALVLPVNPPLSHRRDIQETVIQETDFSNTRKAAQKQEDSTIIALDHLTVAEDSRVGKPGITAARGGVPKPVGELLDRYPKRESATTETDDKAAIIVTIKSLAPELGDQAPMTSSVTRAYHLYQRSRLSLDVFVAEMYGVRSLVRDIASRRHIGNKMSYFFGLLEDRLGLSGRKSEVS